MTADGTWKLVLKTPIGERKSTLTLQETGGVLTGKLANEEGGFTEIFDGKSAGGGFSFKAKVTSPMTLTLEFAGKADGDSISGTVSASGVGNFPFTGTRA